MYLCLYHRLAATPFRVPCGHVGWTGGVLVRESQGSGDQRARGRSAYELGGPWGAGAVLGAGLVPGLRAAAVTLVFLLQHAGCPRGAPLKRAQGRGGSWDVSALSPRAAWPGGHQNHFPGGTDVWSASAALLPAAQSSSGTVLLSLPAHPAPQQPSGDTLALTRRPAAGAGEVRPAAGEQPIR